MGNKWQEAKPKGGFYPESKVYFDGSHYIAIPHTERPCRPRRKPIEEVITVKEDGDEEGNPASGNGEETQNNSAPAEKADALMGVKMMIAPRICRNYRKKVGLK